MSASTTVPSQGRLDRLRERLLALGRLRPRVVAWGREVPARLRPWLDREHWTAENLKAAAAAARRHPWRSALGLTAAFALVWQVGLSTRGASDYATAQVREGPFRVNIVESGTLQALRSVTYASTIQSNQAKIVAMAPEGKLVEKGDLLMLFDSAPFQEEIRRNQALLSQAEADLQKARQDLKLQVLKNQEELATARQKVARSALELRDVQEGKGKLKEEEAAAAVAHAERELKKAQTNLEDLRPLLEEGFITNIELERAEQQAEKAAEDLSLAQRRREALIDFGRPLELSQAESEEQMAKEGLRQFRSAAVSRLEQKRAAITSAESRIQEAASKLAEVREQLARTEVRADVAGIVVYRDVFFGSERRKPQVGDQVWANQPLLILPDVSRMIVETRVRETDVHKVVADQQVRVGVEAFPGLELTGRVTLVGTLAEEEHDRRSSKFFRVTVEVAQTDPRLRPGMTARVEILVEERPKALYVPLDAVFEREGRDVCYLVSRGGIEPRDVTLGPSNQDFVVIEKGLREGQRVSLVDPTSAPLSDLGGLSGQ